MSASVAETPDDFGAPPSGPAQRWRAEIEAFEKEREDWRARVRRIEDRYRDERPAADESRRFALLWANVEVLLPTLYARDPKAEVTRRFKDRDPVGRIAALILERNLAVAIDQDAGGFGRTMRAAVRDFLLGGQGTAWVRYEPVIGMQPPPPVPVHGQNAVLPDQPGMPEPGMPEPGMHGQSAVLPDEPPPPPMPEVQAERVCWDYVHWSDFGFTAGARCWDEVTAVWRRSYLTRDKLVERFGEDLGRRCPLDCKREGEERDDKSVFSKAAIYEIWDSAERRVTWVSKGLAEPLDERPYPLEIASRFPCPAPLFGTLTNGTMTPVPDYTQYQDQAHELDELTGRIAALTRALKLRGFTAKDVAPDLADLLELPGEARLVPVDGWSAMSGQKLGDSVMWLPIQEVAETLRQLLDLRERVKQDAYEITGLSDILRGQSQASETATAQQIKAQWGSIRVRTRQQDVQRFAAQLLQLGAEIMVRHFDSARLAETAFAGGLPQQDQELIGPALELLTGPSALMSYRVDVETDSTVEGDAAADKQAWGELLSGVSSFMQAMMPVVQGIAAQAPAAAPAFTAMIAEMLTGAVRRFSAGPAVEAAIEAAFEALGQAASQPPPQQQPAGPDPLQVKAAEHEDRRVAIEEARAQADIERGRNKEAMDAARLQLDAAEMQARAETAPVAGGGFGGPA